MADKLVITKNGMQEKNFTPEEIAQQEKEKLILKEQKTLDDLKPNQTEIEKAERQLNLITDLTEMGVI